MELPQAVKNAMQRAWSESAYGQFGGRVEIVTIFQMSPYTGGRYLLNLAVGSTIPVIIATNAQAMALNWFASWLQARKIVFWCWATALTFAMASSSSMPSGGCCEQLPTLSLKRLNGQVFLEATQDPRKFTLVNCVSGERITLPYLGPDEKWDLVGHHIMEALWLHPCKARLGRVFNECRFGVQSHNS